MVVDEGGQHHENVEQLMGLKLKREGVKAKI
jgi:hypothetical protein